MTSSSPGPEHGFADPVASPIVRALRRRRRLRQGLVQLAYLVLGVLLALTLPLADLGPTLQGPRVSSMLLVVAGAMFTFIAVVYSLLFLVAQWSTTTFTPRLHLFRDDPVVAHAFGLLVGVFVYCLIAGIVAAEVAEVPTLTAAVAVIGSVASIVVFRLLQAKAFRSIQLASTLAAVADRGRSILDRLYQAPAGSEAPADPGPEPEPAPDAAPVVVRWGGAPGVLCQVDVAGLLRAAERADTVLHLCVPVGGTVRQNGVIARAEAPVEEAAVLGCLEVGLERTFDQDPLLAFRLLVDIALKALSAAVADPVTAVQALDAIEGLLHVVAERRLDVGRLAGAGGHLRVVVPLPGWTDYLELANDEVALAAANTPIVLRRLERLLDDLREDTPDSRWPAVEDRLRWLRHRLEDSAPVLAAVPG